MNKKMLVILASIALIGGIAIVYTANDDRGKMLFEDPSLGGGTTGKSCAKCHPGGRGIAKGVFTRERFIILGISKSSIEEVVNVCIERALGGKAIDPEGQDMKDIVAYMKKLKGWSTE